MEPSGPDVVFSDVHIPVIPPQDVPEEGDGQNDVGGDPGHGVRRAQGVKRQRICLGADDASGHGGGKGQAHGDPGHQLRRTGPQHEPGPADALDAVAHHENEAQEQVHGVIHIQEGVAVSHGVHRDLVGGQEDPQIGVAQGQQQADAHGHRRQQRHHHQGLQGPLADAVVVSGSQVLGGEAGHGRAQGVHRRCCQVEQLVGRTEAHLGGGGHHDAVQHVKLHHHALHDDDANGQHRELQPQGHALHHMAADIAPGDLHVLPVQPQLRILGKGIDEARHRADELSRHRGDGRPGHAPPEHHDEQQVQPHVQHRGKQQEQQRRQGVTHAAQKGADEVIKQLGPDTGEDDEAISIGRLIHLGIVRGHVDPRQHGVQQSQGQSRQQHRQHRRQDDLGGQGPAHPGLVPGPHLAGRHHAEARADAEGELQKDEHQRRGVVDPGHLLGRQGLAHNGCVTDGVYLLQQIRQNHRQRKDQDRFPARPFCQVHGPEQGLFRLFHIKNLRFKGTNDYSPAAPGSSSSRTHKNFVIFTEKTDTFMAYIHNKY